MDAGTMAKVFEPFFTTKDVGKGTGLGLSQVYGFARQSGGDVKIVSEAGRGTTVTLYLPRAHGAVSAVVAEKSEDVALTGKGRVLVVEDNLPVGEVSSMLLEELGYEVTHVDCPAAALSLLEANEKFDMVFSDIVMPGDMDGLTLSRTIRDLYPRLPVLLATGYSSAAERVGAEFPILRKPYDYGTLAKAVKTALAAEPRKTATV
jgi:CheY-like chemotaxis protein